MDALLLMAKANPFEFVAAVVLTVAFGLALMSWAQAK